MKEEDRKVTVSMWHVGSWVLRLPLMFSQRSRECTDCSLPQPYLFGECPWTEWKDKVIGARKEDLEVDPLADTENVGLYAGALGWAFKVPGRGLRGL